MFRFLIVIGCLTVQSASHDPSSKCNVQINTKTFCKHVIPALEGKRKGENGKIGVIGGSTEHTGAPYYAAISALKAGADLVYVITTDSASPVIKSYSPELIVYPFLHRMHLPKITALIAQMDVVIIGPGLGWKQATMDLINDIIHYCKVIFNKPLVIDAGGLYAVSKNITIIKNYPTPGVILTPNYVEADILKRNVLLQTNASNWHSYWGENVSVLVKGKKDLFYSGGSSYRWRVKEGGSGRRAGGQGDILAGVLGTFFKWSINSHVCSKYNDSLHRNVPQLARSIAANAAAHFTRRFNRLAYNKYGRSMTASDMLEEIHNALNIVII